MKKPLFFILISLFVFSCEDDPEGFMIDLDEFQQITEVNPYQDLSPAENVNYWELVFSFPFETEEILASAGNKCADATDVASCTAQFDSTKLNLDVVGGFGIGCLPAFCTHFIRYQKEDQISLVSNKNELLVFLGNIDTQSEAILWAIANNYYFSTTEKEIGAIKTTESGFELLMASLVRDCLPVQTNRYHLKINFDGTIQVLKEEVYSVLEGACI